MSKNFKPKKTNQDYNKNPKIDVTNDTLMVQENLRQAFRIPRHDFSKTPAEHEATKNAQNQYNAQMRAFFGDTWCKRKPTRNVSGMLNVPMVRKDDGSFKITHVKH